jgi:hypothetical protein
LVPGATWIMRIASARSAPAQAPGIDEGIDPDPGAAGLIDLDHARPGLEARGSTDLTVGPATTLAPRPGIRQLGDQGRSAIVCPADCAVMVGGC